MNQKLPKEDIQKNLSIILQQSQSIDLNAVSEWINAVCDFTLSTQCHLDPENQALYQQILQNIFAHIYLQQTQQGAFTFELMRLVPILEKVQYQFQGNLDLSGLESQLNQAMLNQAESVNRFVLASMKLMLNVFLGQVQKAKMQWVMDLSLINPQSIISTTESLELVSQNIRYIFPNQEEILKIFKERVYGSDFQAMSINQQKVAVFWIMAVLWGAYNNQSQIKDCIYSTWLSHYKKALAEKNVELASFLHFPLSHLINAQDEVGESRKTLNKDVFWPMAEYFQTYDSTETTPTKPTNNKIKIGFLTPRVMWNSPTKILYSLLKTIQESNLDYELFLYDENLLETGGSHLEAIKSFKELGITYTSINTEAGLLEQGYLYSPYQKVKWLRNRIQQDQIHVIFGQSSSLSTSYLFATRTACVQIYWWHGNYSYDIPGIDYRVTHNQRDISQYKFEYGDIDFYEFSPGMNEQFYNPKTPENLIQNVRQQYPEKAIILGSLGRLQKLNQPDYLDLICQILEKFPQAIYLACGPGNDEQNGFYQEILSVITEKGLQDRFHFTGMVDAHVYGKVIDFFLNSFPFGHGESLAEYQIKGGLTLSLYKGYEQTDFFYEQDIPYDSLPSLLERKEIKSLDRSIAYSKCDYLRVATHLIENYIIEKQDRDQIYGYTSKIKRLNEKYMNTDLCIRTFQDLIELFVNHKEPDVHRKEQKTITPEIINRLSENLDALQDSQNILFFGFGTIPNLIEFQYCQDIQNTAIFKWAENMNAKGHNVSVNDPHYSHSFIHKATQLPTADFTGSEDVLVLTAVDELAFQNMFKLFFQSLNLKSGLIIIDLLGTWDIYHEHFKKRNVDYRSLK